MIQILVLDDDEQLNQFVCSYLNDSGFHAKGCLRANDAYDLLHNSRYDLIISDIMMPEVDGFEFAKNVRRVNKHIPMLCAMRDARWVRAQSNRKIMIRRKRWTLSKQSDCASDTAIRMWSTN